MVREAVVARYELAAIERKDLPEPMEEERHHAGLAAFEGQCRQIVKDRFRFNLQVGGDRVVVGQRVT